MLKKRFQFYGVLFVRNKPKPEAIIHHGLGECHKGNSEMYELW